MFTQRAQGFQIEFRFRNAPPRPPVGPCFVGNGLDGVLLDLAQYKPLNAVEVNHSWKLHNEPDLGVPLAPSAMDPKSYTPATNPGPLHPDDENLLNWKGSMGDTAAEELKQRRDHARAAARQLVMGKTPVKAFKSKLGASSASNTSSKKSFSRVLDETMQSWMKKTTYLSNDYSRKVHDFKSLAKTKQDLVEDLALREKHLAQRRSAPAISKTFEDAKAKVMQHPTKKHLTPVMEMPFLPNVERWGTPFTHVVMDKSPGSDEALLGEAFVANVEKKDANARMTCQLFIPGVKEEETTNYQGIQQYELDVLPLKEEDAPHDNFCIWVDAATKTATYLPISSRVQLSTGRPLKKKNYNMKVSRRAMNEEDQTEIDEKLAEIDADIEERLKDGSGQKTGAATSMDVDSDDSDQGKSFVNATKTIVAEG